MELIVSPAADGYRAVWGPHDWRCAVGKAGFVEAKREGDGGTPIGVWPLRRLLYRADRLAPPNTALPCLAIGPNDGWCDAPDDPAYNRPVSLPYPASHEVLCREDALYDLVVVLGYNDAPPVPGLGSAIFLHLARDDYGGTEGCVALARDHLLTLLSEAAPGDALRIVTGQPEGPT